MEPLRTQILGEIARLAEALGKPPGQAVFTRETGIREHDWRGVLWARWGDALTEAGLEPNVLTQRFVTADVLLKIVEAARHFGHIPTKYEMIMYRRNDPTFPSKGAVESHFPSRAALLAALATRVATDQSCQDIAPMLPTADTDRTPPISATRSEGFVYLLKSGSHYKIGRSEELERRVKEVRVAMPESVSLVHAIRTDDPAGIESYWHRRFAERRANGEWFKLGPQDLAAFKRRRYQ